MILYLLDFIEMIDYLKDHGLLYKNLCPKFHRILASRACRSAIMIGAPLTAPQIQKVFLFKFKSIFYNILDFG